jgi:hypothetical protein
LISASRDKDGYPEYSNPRARKRQSFYRSQSKEYVMLGHTRESPLAPFYLVAACRPAQRCTNHPKIAMLARIAQPDHLLLPMSWVR